MGVCAVREERQLIVSMKERPVELKTVYVANSNAYYQHELDFEFEHEGETPEEAINYVAYRLGAESYAYLNEITLSYYRVFDMVEFDEAEGVQKVEPFKSEQHLLRTIPESEVKELEAFKEGQMDKQSVLDAQAAMKRKQEEDERRRTYEALKAEFEGEQNDETI